MALQDSHQSSGEDATRAPALAPEPAPVEQPQEDIRRLGEALSARTEDVVDRTRSRTRVSGQALDATVRESFERICTTSTIAVAKWMVGGDPDVSRKARREAGQIFGHLAAQRAAPLNEVTKRGMYWRDAVSEVLRESAAELGVSSQALSHALAVVQFGLDVSLLRMCENSETERQRTDEELEQRQEELERRQEELAFMATHDALTGLPNRTLILDRARQMLMRARRHKTPVAVLFVGLDNFQSINETLSRGAGDELLRAVAERLDGAVRDTDALGRLGGDEFVVIAEELSPTEGPELIAERLQEALEEPFRLAGEHKAHVSVTASIGVATVARSSAEEFLRDADIAMRQAKWDGKNRYAVFEPGMKDAVQSRMELGMDLRDALLNDEFSLVYQPTFNLSDMSPTGVEALIRWRHASRGVVQPNDFIPLLEETGLIIEVGQWVLQEACRQGAIWSEAGHSIGMAVNVSARQLDSDEFVDDVRNALSESGLDASALTLEVTETTLMRNAEEAARRLTAIRELGVRIAIDDFGTGYSSLAHLQQFPVDALKIDRSFISRLTENPEGETFIHTLVQLGKALSIQTLAEGIEQPQELSMLQREHCDSGQGFLLARPLDADAAETFLQTWAGNGAPALTVNARELRPVGQRTPMKYAIRSPLSTAETPATLPVESDVSDQESGAPSAYEPPASSSSWLCRDGFDRQRMLDMDERVRPARQWAIGILGLSLVLLGPWVGWWPLLFLPPAAVFFATADRLKSRVARPEYPMFAAFVGCQLTIAGAVMLAGGAHAPGISWLAIAPVVLSSRFSMRGVIAGVLITIVLVLAVAFGVDAHQVLREPALVVVPFTLVICVAILSTPLMQSDIQHRGDAVIDQLTGMLNRKALRARVDELAQQSAVTGDPIGLIVGDLDRFKSVNDTHGHATGDAVLKEVAYLMRKQLRAFDLAYRIGGEEFLIVLPGSDLERSAELADQLREAVSANDLGGGVPVTMSFGVGASDRGEKFDYETVFAKADAALYRAKLSGRDQVCVVEREEVAALV